MSEKLLSKKFFFILLFLTLFLLTGCISDAFSSDKSGAGKDNKENNDNKLIVAVTIAPQETFVRAIGSDIVEVVLMVPPGYSYANYEPTPREIELFSRSDVYFTIGTTTEAANIIPLAGNIESLEIVRLHEIVAEKYPYLELSHFKRDVHIWLSPKRVMVMIEAMAEKMASLDEKNREFYEANAAEYISQLDELDSYLKNAFKGLAGKKFIVFHPAFGYLADDYGLEMYALEKDGKEATPARLKEMIDLAREEDIRVIFYQSEIDSLQSRAFAEEIGGEAIQLEPLSPDYINNLKKMADIMVKVLG